MTNLVGLRGSLRHSSLNRKLLNEAVRLYRPDEYEEVDLSLPLFDEDMETTGIPVKVKEVAAVIEKADAIIIASLENNMRIPCLKENGLGPLPMIAFKYPETSIPFRSLKPIWCPGATQ